MTQSVHFVVHKALKEPALTVRSDDKEVVEVQERQKESVHAAVTLLEDGSSKNWCERAHERNGLIDRLGM